MDLMHAQINRDFQKMFPYQKVIIEESYQDLTKDIIRMHLSW